MHFAYFSGFLIGISAARRRKPHHPVFWVDHELPGGEGLGLCSACSGLLWFGGKGILTTFGPKGRD